MCRRAWGGGCLRGGFGERRLEISRDLVLVFRCWEFLDCEFLLFLISLVFVLRLKPFGLNISDCQNTILMIQCIELV
jgi:hypothetical protein